MLYLNLYSMFLLKIKIKPIISKTIYSSKFTKYVTTTSITPLRLWHFTPNS